ncbi:MAG: GNAT family N-acetyltransferase [Lachnospiraceae bacterium]|nr:GNAT family N-acetyltransferase [Lachnospiraceae bacterium]
MGNKRVVVMPYDEAWADDFIKIRDEIKEVLGTLAMRIEHVGSTSVRGLSAKPIIDIDVVIRDRQVLEEVISALAEIGYRHEGDLGIAGREAFKYDGKEHLRKHHLYVCTQDCAELKRHIAFRDYLRSHPEAIREYGRIKEEGARLYPDDMDKYIEHKSPVIQEIYERMNTDFLIRKADVNDIPALRILYRLLEEDGVHYQPEHFVIGERTEEFFQTIFDSDTQDILVADIDGEAIGFVHCMIIPQKKVSCLKPQTVVYLQDLCVREDMRNKGIGSVIMRAAKDYGKEKGADFIRTQVFPGNVGGMCFYERNGFCEMMKTIECQSLD